MRKKIYRTIIYNNGEVTTMIIDGESKKSVTKKLTDFFMKTNKIKDYRNFEIYLKEVIYINGDYINLE